MTKFFFMAAVVAIASSCGTDERSNRTNPHQKGLALTKVCDESPKAGLVAPAAVQASANKRYCVKLEWLHGPMVADYSRARLTIVAPDLSAPGKIKNVSVTPWMKIHGHGTGDVQPELAPVNERPYEFIVTNIYFIMSGPWELNISATVDGEVDSLEYKVDVP